MCSSAAAFSFDFVRAGTLAPIALVRIEVGCVAWQVENLDAIGSLGKPGFDWL
jgi:hypothetical protein